MKTPTLTEVQSVLLKLQSADRQTYFFERLKNPEWLAPLKKAGVFKNPPGPVKQGTSLYFPPWPPTTYLKNIVAERPTEVAEIVAEIDSMNPTVQSDLADIMTMLPPSLAAPLAQKAELWLEQHLFSRLPMSLEALLVHLIVGGEKKAALRLGKKLLGVEPRERVVKSPFSNRPDAVAIISDWYYAQAVAKTTQAALANLSQPIFQMLCQILVDALEIENGPRQADDAESITRLRDDYSAIWMEDLEKAPSSQEPNQILSHHLFAFAKAIVDADRDGSAFVYSSLEKQTWVVFWRILLRIVVHLDDTERAIKYLTSSDFWSQSGIDPERRLLGNTFFPRLNDDQFEAAATSIRASVPVENLGRWHKNIRNAEPTPDEMNRLSRQFLFEQFEVFSAVLRGSAADEFEALKSEFGEPEGDEDVGTHEDGIWMGPTSPKTADELEKMSPAEIVALLRSWKPKGGWRQHTPEGLGRSLQSIIARTPEAYLAIAGDLAELPPVYVRNIVAAFTDAIRARLVVSWKSLLSFLEVSLRRTHGAFPQDFENIDSFDADADWTALRQRVALLFDDILRDDSFPTEFAGPVLSMLRDLSEDADPTPEWEEKRGALDPSNAALNSVRGAALLSVIRYIFWLHRQLKDTDAQPRPWDEAFVLLSEHLDVDVDPSAAVRSVYGQYLPWLQSVDEEWAARNVERIFPSDPRQSHLFHAAWTTYLVFCPIYYKTYEILKPIYAEAVARIDQEKSTDRFEIAAREHLCNHVWILYARGQSALDDPNSLISMLLEKAPDDLLAELVASVGRALQTDKTMPSEAVDRLKQLWSKLLDVLARNPHRSKPQVLRPFGWWFSAKILDEQWALDNLAVALARTGGNIDPEFQVLPRLAELSQRFPLDAIKLLEQMAVAMEPFHVHNIREHGGPIVEAALSAGGVAATTAQRVHTLLANQGMRDFRIYFEK